MRNWLATRLAYILFFIAWLKQHRRIRGVFVWGNILLGSVWLLWGPSPILAVAQLGFNLLFGIAFMIIQFGTLFWFISRTRTTKIIPGSPKVATFNDYWGNETVVKRAREWNQLLTQDRAKFEAMGGRTIAGLLFVGPPGTGKSFLAKCMAGSNGVAYLGTDGSDFRGMFWGMDTLKMMSFLGGVRGLAREYGGAIGFIDEIDALGSSRGGMQGGQTQMGMMGGAMGMGGMMNGALNRLLYEIGGIDEQSLWNTCQNRARAWFGLPPTDLGRFMIIGATNRPEVLDRALTRSGRLSMKIVVPPPDKHSRRLLLSGYVGKVTAEEGINVEELIGLTARTTPADIEEAITRNAVRIAFFAGRDRVSQRDIEDGLEEQVLGLQNPISELEPAQRNQIAIHEAGHAVAQYHMRKDERIGRLSIERRNIGLGYMRSLPLEDTYVLPLRLLAADVMISMAGHISTEVFLGEPWTGAGSDFETVGNTVQLMASLGWFGEIPFGPDPKAWSGTLKTTVDHWLKDTAAAVGRLLVAHEAEVLALRDALLERGDLSGSEATAIIEAAIKDNYDPLGDYPREQ